MGGIYIIDGNEKFVDGGLEEGVRGCGRRGVGCMGVDDSCGYGILSQLGGPLVNAAKGKGPREGYGSDCQRYDIFNNVADNVDKYS